MFIEQHCVIRIHFILNVLTKKIVILNFNILTFLGFTVAIFFIFFYPSLQNKGKQKHIKRILAQFTRHTWISLLWSTVSKDQGLLLQTAVTDFKYKRAASFRHGLRSHQTRNQILVHEQYMSSSKWPMTHCDKAAHCFWLSKLIFTRILQAFPMQLPGRSSL